MRRRIDFQRALRGRRAGRRTLVAHLAAPATGSVSAPGPGAGQSRRGKTMAVQDAADRAIVGFVVSRAVGSATVRHRVQRQLRHLMLPYLSRLPAGARVVVRALPAAATAANGVLASDLDAVLSRLLGQATVHATRGPQPHDVPLPS